MLNKCEKAAAALKRPIILMDAQITKQGTTYYHVIAGDIRQGFVNFLGIEFSGCYAIFYSPIHSSNDLVDMIKVNIENHDISVSNTVTKEDQLFVINV
jgi:hypothetical protein